MKEPFTIFYASGNLLLLGVGADIWFGAASQARFPLNGLIALLAVAARCYRSLTCVAPLGYLMCYIYFSFAPYYLSNIKML